MVSRPTVDGKNRESSPKGGIPSFHGLLYPLHQVPLTFIVTFAVLISLAVRANFGPIPSIPGLLVMIFATSWLLKYGYVLFDSITTGETKPPVLSYEMIQPFSDWRPLVQIGVLAGLYSGLHQLNFLLPHALVLLVSAVVLVLVPASIGILGSTHNVFHAINPHAIFKFIRAVGWAYAALVIGAILLIALGCMFAPSSALDLLMPRFFACLGIAYVWLAIYCVLGSVMFEKRLQLGLETAFSPEQSAAREDQEVADEHEKIIDEVYRHWRVQSFQNAWSTVERHVSSVANPADELLWIHKRVVNWSDAAFSERVARMLLPKLLEQRRYTEAINTLRLCFSRNKQFRPASSTELLHLVDVARQAGARDVVTQLLTDFEQMFPNDSLQARVAELRASIGAKSPAAGVTAESGSPRISE